MLCHSTGSWFLFLGAFEWCLIFQEMFRVFSLQPHVGHLIGPFVLGFSCPSVLRSLFLTSGVEDGENHAAQLRIFLPFAQQSFMLLHPHGFPYIFDFLKITCVVTFFEISVSIICRLMLFLLFFSLFFFLAWWLLHRSCETPILVPCSANTAMASQPRPHQVFLIFPPLRSYLFPNSCFFITSLW